MFALALNFCLAFTSSVSAVYLLFTSSWPNALGAHLVALGCSGFVMAIWFKLKKSDQNGLWLLTMIPIALFPGFCLVGLPMAMIYGATPPKVAEIDLTMLVPTPILPFKPLQFDSNLAFSRGGLFEVLERSGDPEKRLVAVMATTRMPSQLAIPLLKIAMRDAVDDVRLLAYSIKDKHESVINENIKELSDGLGLNGSVSEASGVDEPITLERASAFRSLAFAYWELVYLELAEGEIRKFCLAQSIEHAERALHTLKDAPVALLLARAYLQLGDTAAATEALQQALDFGVQKSVIAPFEAEIAFTEYRYADVADALKHSSSASYDRLNDVCHYWQKTA